MDEVFRKAERQGEDLEIFHRRLGAGFSPTSRIEFPICPLTACSHESYSLSTSYCRNDKCYVANWVTKSCADRFAHRSCVDYVECECQKTFQFFNFECLCPCHVSSHEEWFKKFNYIPEEARVYNRDP